MATENVAKASPGVGSRGERNIAIGEVELMIDVCEEWSDSVFNERTPQAGASIRLREEVAELVQIENAS